MDLAIIKPDGTEVAETNEVTDGEVLQVNIDDDDNDAGSGNHPTPDKDDTNGVSGENDLLSLKLHKIEPNGLSNLTYKLHFSSSKIAVWAQSNKTQSVVSDSTVFSVANDTNVYVEGLSPSATTNGELVTLRAYDGSQFVAEDSVKIVVAKMLFAIIGDGGAGESALRSYLDGVKKDQRTDPYIVKNTNGCYSVFIWNTEKMAKIALEAQDGCVVYDGHSNFGMGFAFSSGLTTISAFMNIAEDLMAINWPYLRDEQGHPNLWIEDSEYGDDTTSTNQFDPWIKEEWSIVGKLYTTNTYRFYSTPQSGATHLSLTRGVNKYEDYHYGSTGDIRIVVKCGSADMPNKNWSKLFLNSCDSGQYYYQVFGHGTLFYTVLECSSPNTTKAFLQAIIEGKDADGILSAINNAENVNDYHSF